MLADHYLTKLCIKYICSSALPNHPFQFPCSFQSRQPGWLALIDGFSLAFPLFSSFALRYSPTSNSCHFLNSFCLVLCFILVRAFIDDSFYLFVVFLLWRIGILPCFPHCALSIQHSVIFFLLIEWGKSTSHIESRHEHRVIQSKNTEVIRKADLTFHSMVKTPRFGILEERSWLCQPRPAAWLSLRSTATYIFNTSSSSLGLVKVTMWMFCFDLEENYKTNSIQHLYKYINSRQKSGQL